MHIEIHGFNVVFHGVSNEDVEKLCNDILKIKYKAFVITNKKDTAILKYAFGKGKRSVYIRVYRDNDTSYISLELKGSFFDNSPNFRLKKLLKFISRFKNTPKQLDIAFNDDKKCILRKEIKHWCKYSDDYCTGSLVSREAPGFFARKGKLHRIQLGSAGSTANFGTIYWRPDTRFLRIEIKFKDKKKIEHILENYSRKDPQQFYARSIEALVGCINFISARSKKNRVASKYVMQKSWKAFLGSDVKKINWRQINAKKEKNRLRVEGENFDASIRRQATMVNNMFNRLTATHSEEDILKSFAENSGYDLVKRDVF